MENDKSISRSQTMEALAGTELDLLIIGGGIVGAGIARDAAMRGLRTALVEQYDFASGTSSRSSRLLHGGLRYLAQGRIGLVREAGIEKSIVHNIAPHVSEPLPFIFPTYKVKWPWSEWALWQLNIGVRIYDILSGIRDFRKSRGLSRKKTMELLPGLKQEQLTGGVRYYDGLTNDARLVVDSLRAAHDAGAIVINYCRYAHSENNSGLWTCELVDQLTGDAVRAKTKCIVNATGPWADQIEHSSVHLRPTKGVHVVVKRDRIPVPDAVVMTAGSRILFAIPWGERVILGTTDTDYKGAPEDVRVEPEDVTYIIDIVNGSFPEVKLTQSDIISAWAGLRPLIASPNGGPSDISRSHEIRNPRPGWWDVAGGKLTTYRLMAEQTVDKLEKYLGRAHSACVTAQKPLLPADQAEPTSAIVPLKPTKELVQHFCRSEWAIHLDDVMIRRGGWTHYNEDSDKLALQVADWMAETLGWDDDRKKEEIGNYGRG